MEMCYDGALVMPSRYAMMDEEEMMYLDGGAIKIAATFSASQCNKMAAIACIVGGVITFIAGIAAVVSAVKTFLTAGATFVAWAIWSGIATAAAGITGTVSGYLWFASANKGLNILIDTNTYAIATKIRY